MRQIKNQKGMALVAELVVIALVIGLAMVVFVKIKETKASRADGVSGGAGSSASTRPCNVINTGTKADGTTIYQYNCRQY